MGNRSVRKSIHSLRQRILEHQQKIESEQAKSLPNQGLIAHWESEIGAFTIRVRRLEDRLARRRRRGRRRK